ncbi:D-alanyl-D-alanine carboxypeptidase/D-alanyl-D-alanine-endopeptidase [Geminocystis sp. CENA526]|uniref:D-alanyl-D-alanine carboxypeptidase/D-alanyl-D-alanine endopeptidase n=1 Tax=Geminocystis sp. CENA526 TaxID=1355871 RepID=UPI003D6F6FC3
MIKPNLFLIFSYIFLFFPLPIIAQQSVNVEDKKICVNNLSQEIELLINEPSRQKETWGIVIENLKDNQVLYQLNSDKFLIPASNIKLLTTASVLKKLGSDFTIDTPISIERKSTDNQLLSTTINSLIIEGKGDPTFSQKQLDMIAKKLAEEGIKKVNNLILIDGYLSEPSTNYTWEFEDIYFYFAVPVNSLILDQNTVNFTLVHGDINKPPILQWSNELAGKQWLIENRVYTRDENSQFNISVLPLFARSSLVMTGDFPINKETNTWRLSIPNPTLYFQESLVKTLNNYAIEVENKEIIEQKQKLDIPQQFLLEISSPTLAELITITNQDSNNLYAEVLLKYLGDESQNEWESLEKIAQELGISKDDYRIRDGSGLSRHNLITPSALVTLLKAMNNSQYKEIFYNSLSVAGKNGTLKNRFQNTNIADNLYGKTGTLTGVASLSGYLKTAHYDDIVFSIIVNHSIANSPTLRNSIDQIVLLLGKLERCSFSEM